jgi:hypothetical protein
MSGHLVTGVGPRPGLAIIGYRGAGSCRRGKPLCGCRVSGRPEREAGCGSRATGSELTQYNPTFLKVDTPPTISAKPVGVGAASQSWIPRCVSITSPDSSVKFRPSASGLGCVIPFVERMQINMPEQAREEMIKYCAAHPESPTAAHRPQLSLRKSGLWIALLGSSVEDGILGIGATVEDALRAFDNRYALHRVEWKIRSTTRSRIS